MLARPVRLVAAIAIGLALGLGPFSTVGSTSATDACGLNANCVTIMVVGGDDGDGTLTSGYARTPSSVKLARLDCVSANGVTSGVCQLTFEWPSGPGSFSLDESLTPSPGSYACQSDGCLTEGTTATQTGVFFADGQTYLVDANFMLATRTLSVTGTGPGSGTVDVVHGLATEICKFPGGCPGTKMAVTYGTAVTLQAIPDQGATFAAWTGACFGQSSTCHLRMDSAYPTVAVSTNVVFELSGPTAAPTSRPTHVPGATPPLSTGAIPSTATSAGTTSVAATAAPPAATPRESSAVPTAAPAADVGVPVGVVAVIVLLAALAAAFAVGLVVALRRKPS